MVTLLDLLLYLHVGDVLHIFEIVALLYELVLEVHDVAMVVVGFALVATCLLALIACKHDF